MVRYQNLSGKSGIAFYEMGADFVIVEWKSGARYLYNYDSCGRDVIEGMKILAQAGLGLSAFISRYLHDKYAEQLKPPRS